MLPWWQLVVCCCFTTRTLAGERLLFPCDTAGIIDYVLRLVRVYKPFLLPLFPLTDVSGEPPPFEMDQPLS